MAVDDEGYVVLLAQRVPQLGAVLSNGRPRGLKQQSGGGVSLCVFNVSKPKRKSKVKFLEVRTCPF